MAYDINRLRQQALFNDIMSGGIMGGEDPYQQQQPMGPFSPVEFPQQQTQTRTAPQLPMQQRQPMIPQPTPQLRMPTPTMGLPQQPSSTEADIQGLIDMANKFYTPQTRASDRFNSLLDQFPERQNPSLARSIVAGGLGLGSKNPLEDMEKYQYAPYYRDVAAWKEKAGPFQQGASLENSANSIERQLATTMVSGANTANKNAQLQATAVAKQEEINRNNLAKQEIEMIKARAQQARASKWEVKIVGDRVKAFSPDGQRSVDLGPSGNMTEYDKVQLEGQWDVKVAEQSGANAAIGGWIPMVDDNGRRYEWNPRTNETRAASPVRGPGGQPAPTSEQPEFPFTRFGGNQGNNQLNPNEQDKDRSNRIRAAIDKNPDWGKYYDRETDRFVPPSASLIGGVSAQEKMDYDKFRKTIDPNYESTYIESRQGPNSSGDQAGAYTSTTGTSGTTNIGRNTPTVTPERTTPQPIVQFSPSTKQYRISYDGGKTWQPYNPGGR